MRSNKLGVVFLIGLALLLWPAGQSHSLRPAWSLRTPQEDIRQLQHQPKTAGSFVKTADKAAVLEYAREHGLTVTKTRRLPDGQTIIAFSETADDSRLATLDANSEDIKVRPNVVYHAQLTPDDPLYPQWYTTNIKAPAAWDITTGASNVTVAVIDTGFGLTHEDLENRWYLNPNENGTTLVEGIAPNCTSQSMALDKKCNNLDDDTNGLVDDWRGWDFIGDDKTPDSPGQSHGTKVAGLVGATGNNAKGVASINWAAKILPLQVLDNSSGSGTTIDVVSAMAYARAQGVQVISMSLGTTTNDAGVRDEVVAAKTAGIIMVAAAGNCGDPGSYLLNGCDQVGQVLYPANYPDVIAVAAVDSSDNRASFSSYGSNVDIAAPGAGSIQTPTWDSSLQINLYSTSANGTSFATPIVSGLAALVKSGFPSATAAEVERYLKFGADKVAAMNDQEKTDAHGYGRIQAQQSLLPNTNVPVYRMANYINKERLLTSNINEKGSINGQNGWVYEGVAFRASSEGTVTAYRLANHITRERLITINAAERDAINGQNGWVYEGEAFKIPAGAAVPVYRMANYINKERLLTTDQAERDAINGQNGWVYEGEAFKVAG